MSRNKGIKSMRLNSDERGNAYIEFVLVASFFFVPLSWA